MLQVCPCIQQCGSGIHRQPQRHKQDIRLLFLNYLRIYEQSGIADFFFGYNNISLILGRNQTKYSNFLCLFFQEASHSLIGYRRMTIRFFKDMENFSILFMFINKNPVFTIPINKYWSIIIFLPSQFSFILNIAYSIDRSSRKGNCHPSIIGFELAGFDDDASWLLSSLEFNLSLSLSLSLFLSLSGF